MIETHAREYLLDIPLWTKKKNTLGQVRDFLHELGDPDRKMDIIHVAGTNGKGSVCADLTSVLVEAGYHVGTFVSPHLVDVKERFLFDGESVDEAAFEESFRRVLAVVQAMRGREYCHPSFFEFVFLMAMVLYDGLKPDYVILETGLGGRLDTTNVVERPAVCIITSISLDHTRYLGDTIPQIAAEKAGIIKAGVPVIYDGSREDAAAVIRAKAREMGADAYEVTEEDVGRSVAGQVEFAAPYQAVNAALAVKALEILAVKGAMPDVDDEAIRKGLGKVHWPGRMESLGEDIWLDGAHNPGGIDAFIQAVKGQPSDKRIQLLFAAVSDKDYREMIRRLCKGLPITRVTVVHLNSDRGLDTGLLAEEFTRAGCPLVEQYGTVEEALAAALVHKTDVDRLYVVGSLYLIGEIRAKCPYSGPERKGYAGF